MVKHMRYIYLLKDLSKKTGYSTHTLKYYYRLGLFNEMGRSPATNFRYFDEKTIARLKEIQEMKGSGLSLNEIKQRFERQ